MKTSSQKLPASLSFNSLIEIQASGEENPLPQFSMVAYTGASMTVRGFGHPVVVDLAGVDISRQQIPVRMDHNVSFGVGHTSVIEVADNKLLAKGLISRDTSWARDVAKSGSNGFPWQASIGAAVIKTEFIACGQDVKVNDQNFTGPIYVIRQSMLKEISFVDSGADSLTSAKVVASNDKDSETPAKENISAENSVLDYRKMIAAEALRIENIRKLCGSDHADILAKAIEEGWDLTKTELHILRASRPNIPNVISKTAEQNSQVFEAAALISSGLRNSVLESSYSENILDAADKFRGIGIQEFCELACGMQLPRFGRDAGSWLQAAFSTTRLPAILSNIANKMLLEGYSYIEDTWRKICKIASVNDFKEHTRYRMTGNFTFNKVGADGELKHGNLGEQIFKQQADTHGIMFSLTRQMIINDDLGAFADIPRQIGMGAAEAIADAVWKCWLSNPKQADNKTFFHTDHKNYLKGDTTNLSIDSLTNAEVLFSEQVKPNGRPLGIPASMLLVPASLKVLAQQLMQSLQLNQSTATPEPASNPHVGKFEVVSSSYLSNSSFAGSSSKAWYLLADPNRIPAIEVAFLNGVDKPTVEKTDADFNTLGIQFRGFIDFGVREQDHRAAIKMKGSA